jgi:hypothetical protein
MNDAVPTDLDASTALRVAIETKASRHAARGRALQDDEPPVQHSARHGRHSALALRDRVYRRSPSAATTRR